MKKLILSLFTILSLQAHADYVPGPVTRVIIPNKPASGISALYRNMEAYAAKNNIIMIPVYAPGAESKIGSRQAETADGDTLFLSVISDVAQHSDLTKLAPVSAVSEAVMSLVTSKKSKLFTIDDIVSAEKSSPGKLNWLHSSSAHLSMINTLADASDIDRSKLTLIPMSGSKMSQSHLIMTGDADVSFISSYTARKLSEGNRITEIKLNSKTKLALDRNAISTGLFLANNHDVAAVKFWTKFVENYGNSDEAISRQRLGETKLLPPGSKNLIDMINNWKSK